MRELLKKYEEIISYLIVGGFTTLVSLLTYYLLVYTLFDPKVTIELQITNVLAWVVSVTFAYFANRKFVFKSADKMSLKEVINFYVSRLSTLIIDMGLMYLLVSVLNFNDKIIKIVVQVVVIILNYILSKFIVFKKE